MCMRGGHHWSYLPMILHVLRNQSHYGPWSLNPPKSYLEYQYFPGPHRDREDNFVIWIWVMVKAFSVSGSQSYLSSCLTIMLYGEGNWGPSKENNLLKAAQLRQSFTSFWSGFYPGILCPVAMYQLDTLRDRRVCGTGLCTLNKVQERLAQQEAMKIFILWPNMFAELLSPNLQPPCR